MALTTLPQIGELRDNLRRQLGRARWRQLRHAIVDGDTETIVDILASVHLTAGLTAYDLVAAYADVPELTPELLVEMADAANLFAEDAAVRALAARTLPPGIMEAYPEMLLDQGMGQGYEFGAEEAAAAADLQFKTWVRTYDPKGQPRHHHVVLEGQTIPADERFTIPASKYTEAVDVDGPHDYDHAGAEQWYNCGHALVWTPSAELRDVLGEIPVHILH